MANTLTALAPTLFSAAKRVAAEPFGAIDAIDASFDDKSVAKGDTVDVPVAPTRDAKDFTPGAQSNTGDDATGSTTQVQITKSRKVDWHLTGEQERSLENGGINQDWVQQLISQGMRTLRNEAEADAVAAIKVGASRAYGTAGTTPFASDLKALTNARKILQDNGAPLADLQFVANSDSGLNLRNLGIIAQADQAGSEEERRSGRLLRQYGFAIRESGGIAEHTAGTANGASPEYLINQSGGYAIGAQDLTLDTGSGTILAGDVVTIAGDASKYVVNDALASNVIGLGRPGLLAAAADDSAVTVGDAYTPNFAFERSAVVGIMRPPVMPANPTIEQMLISDQFGMTYLMLDIKQYGQRTWELHLAWGFKAVNGEFIATVLG